MTAWKPTAVQRDVIDRLQDGWTFMPGLWVQEIVKAGEAPRHVRFTTVASLDRRGIIKWEWDGQSWRWVLVDGADA